MSNLLDEVTEAGEFIEEITNNIEQYKLFEGEEFAEIGSGVAATSDVDLQGDQIAMQTLASMVDRFSENVVWMQAEHSPLIQPVGRVIAVQLFYSPLSRCYFVVVVFGNYNPKKHASFKSIGIDVERLPVTDECVRTVNSSAAGARIVYNPHEINPEIIAGLLEDRPQIVNIHPVIAFRKAIDPLTILQISLSYWFLTSNPFSKSLLNRLGEKTADQVIEFSRWVKDKVITEVTRLTSERVMFVFTSAYKGCHVEFVIASKDAKVLINATESVSDAACSAMVLVDKIEHLEPTKLVYDFDLKIEKWLPRYAATKLAGIISDRPTLIALDKYKGLSIGGIVTRDE